MLAYYGIDWLSVILGLYGSYLVSERNKFGFVLVAVSALCATWVCLVAGTYAFLASNIPAVLINMRGFLKWHNAIKAV